MRRALLVLFALAAAPTWAEERPDPTRPAAAEATHGRFELGVGVGYAYGLGRETRDALMGDLTLGTLPLVVDAGFALSEHLAVGAYAGYGPMFAKGCPEAVSCSGRSLRLGLRLRYRFAAGASLVPWLAVGAGYERLSESDTYQDTTVDSAATGMELLRLELGAEHRISRSFALGPFVTGSLGQFFTRDFGGVTRSIDARAYHFWLMAGLRGSFWL